MKKILLAILVCALAVSFGCASSKKKTSALQTEVDSLKAQLAEAEGKLEAMRKEKDAEIARLMEEKGSKIRDLEEAREALAKQLEAELTDARAKLEITEKGLVITFLSEVFFDSGKADIKPESYATLDKVAEVLNTTLKERPVAVEGHTDNDPIKYSGWKSNWDLSSGRSLAVLHYFIDKKAVAPERLSFVGYGEFHPVAPNDTPENKRKNRRVEIVVIPEKLKKIREA